MHINTNCQLMYLQQVTFIVYIDEQTKVNLNAPSTFFEFQGIKKRKFYLRLQFIRIYALTIK